MWPIDFDCVQCLKRRVCIDEVFPSDKLGFFEIIEALIILMEWKLEWGPTNWMRVETGNKNGTILYTRISIFAFFSNYAKFAFMKLTDF